MTPDELTQKLRELNELLKHDPEALGCEADGLLVATLRALGYGEAMDVYESLHTY